MKYFKKICPLANIALLLLFNVAATQAADITYEKYGASYILNIDGTIKKGDYKNFIRSLSEIFTLATNDFHSEMSEAKKNHSDTYDNWVKKYGIPSGAARITLSLNSLGGDVVEAIKIGKTARDMLLKTDTGWDTRTSNHKDLKCMSACFFIWVSGIDRNGMYRDGEKPLGIHRLYFEKDYYKGLTSKQAEVKYKSLKQKAIEFIEEMDVPEKYIDKMFTVPSNEVYLISKDEIDDLDGKTPYYEELLFSRCSSYTKQEENDYMECVIGEGSKCNNMSSSYLSYIETKIQDTDRCFRVHDGIERWERMNNYFKSSASK